MREKINSCFRYYSNYIFPTIIFIACYFIKSNTKLFELDDDKMDLIVSVASSFIGVLLTVLTIYLAIPKNAVRVKQLRESKHQHIYLINLLTGIILSLLSILVWIFFNNTFFACSLFLASISNMIITIYYTFSLIKIMEN